MYFVDGEGLTFTLDRFDPGGDSLNNSYSLTPGDLAVPFQVCYLCNIISTLKNMKCGLVHSLVMLVSKKQTIFATSQICILKHTKKICEFWFSQFI